MYFDSARWDQMLDKLMPLVKARKCNSLLDYYYILKYSDEVGDEWHNVIDALSIQETYFWRELDQIQALAKKIVPEWFSHRITPFRIWSAACATGEEPLSIAMALHEAGHGIETFSNRRIGRQPGGPREGSEGVYRERSFRNLPSELRDKYFVKVGGWLETRFRNYCARITFRQANITVRERCLRTGKSGCDLLPQRFHLFFARNHPSHGSVDGRTSCPKAGTCSLAQLNRC